jgi:hypothetical protein
MAFVYTGGLAANNIAVIASNGLDYKINKDTFVKFAIHLFYGSVGDIKEGLTEKSYVKPKTGLIRHKLRPSCTNITPELLEDAKINSYKDALSNAEKNQQYNNGGWNLVQNPPDIGDAKLGDGSIAIVGSNGVNIGFCGIKVAILAVIECFVTPQYRIKYDYDRFKSWLAADTPVADGGIPSDALFSAQQAIDGRIKTYFVFKNQENTLSADLTALYDFVPTLTDPGGGVLGPLVGVDLSNLYNKLNIFKTTLGTLHKNTLDNIKINEVKKGDSFYSRMLIENEELRLQIKRLGGNPTPNNTINQIKVNLQFAQVTILKNMLADPEVSGGITREEYINDISDNTRTAGGSTILPTDHTGGVNIIHFYDGLLNRLSPSVNRVPRDNNLILTAKEEIDLIVDSCIALFAQKVINDNHTLNANVNVGRGISTAIYAAADVAANLIAAGTAAIVEASVPADGANELPQNAPALVPPLTPAQVLQNGIDAAIKAVVTTASTQFNTTASV